MPRLVRQRPLSERLQSFLNPMDFLLWLSEELETRDWDSNLAGTQLGVALNVIFLLARANYGKRSSTTNDLFDDERGPGWLSLLIYPLVWALAVFSITNALYTLARTRKYRLFAADVEVKPSTPSARRVKINSSPYHTSPLRFISEMLAPDTAESRAHPDAAKEVWELAVWDPLPICLQLTCWFGPGHVLIYLISLPLAPMDPRPSVAVFNTLVTQAVLSALLLMLTSRFAQQAKDNAIIQAQVMHEYNTNFVQPQLHPVVRDVGTQVSEYQPKGSRAFVQVGTPTTLIRKSTASREAPSQSSSAADGMVFTGTPDGESRTTSAFTPSRGERRLSAFPSTQEPGSSPTRRSLPASYASNSTPPNNTDMPTSARGNPNFGGHLSVHMHSQSPLKKSTSLYNVNSHTPRHSRDMAAWEQRGMARSPSPTKPPHADYRHSPGAFQGGKSFSTMSLNRRQPGNVPPRW